MNEEPGLHHLPAIVILGPRACGKTLLLGFLARLYGGGLVVGDSSEICDNEIKNNTDVGRQLQACATARSSGDLYPSGLAVKAALNHIETCTKRIQLSHTPYCGIVLAGAGRDPDQVHMLTAAGYVVHFVHITSTLREVFEGVMRRIVADEAERARGQTALARTDTSVTAVIRSWAKYKTSIVAAVNSVPADRILEVKKSSQFSDIANQVVQFCAQVFGDDSYHRYRRGDHDLVREAKRLNHVFETKPKLTEEMEEAISAHEKNRGRTMLVTEAARTFGVRAPHPMGAAAPA